jgi:hypothetical protein
MEREWVPAFLAALARSPNVSAAALAAGVGRRTVYDYRAADDDFARRWDEALDESTDDLVGECYRRAREGCEKPVYYQGEECGRLVEYSDTLAIFLLKAHRPAVYGDKSKVELAGPGGRAIPLAFEQALDKVYGDDP